MFAGQLRLPVFGAREAPALSSLSQTDGSDRTMFAIG